MLHCICGSLQECCVRKQAVIFVLDTWERGGGGGGGRGQMFLFGYF